VAPPPLVVAPAPPPAAIIEPWTVVAAHSEEDAIAAEWPVEPVMSPAPTPAFGITVSSLTPAAHVAYTPQEAPVIEPAIEGAAPSRVDEADAMDFGFAATSPEAEASLEDAFGVTDAPSTPRRPVTSEMIAIDAFAAFDSVWGPGNTPRASPAIEPPPALDAESLGSAAQTESLWADEITADPAQGETGAHSTSSMPDAAEEESTWSRAVTPNSALPAWLMDDVHTAPAVEPPREEPPQDAMLGDYAPYVAMPDGGEPMILESPVTPPEAPQIDPRHAHGLRVSATLDRLAERIRGGEIDVSSVAPEAPEAAVLASVLAALLGGSGSR